jgi:FkbM family methyltransferase
MPKRYANDLISLEPSNRLCYQAFQLARYVPVIKRIYPSLLKKWARLTWTGGFKVKRYKGFLLLLNYRNALDRKIGLHGGHEMAQFTYFFSTMEKGCDVFIDIGANIGTYALQAAQHGLAPEIHAFEPDPRNYAQLQGNLCLNKFTDVIQAHDFALSDAHGLLDFELGPDNKPDLTKIAPGASAAKKFMAKPLDDVLPFRGKKIFFKIDTEGHEREIIKGAAQILKNNSCFLQVEAWTDNAASLKSDLEALGYSCIHRIQNDYYFQAA